MAQQPADLPRAMARQPADLEIVDVLVDGTPVGDVSVEPGDSIHLGVRVHNRNQSAPEEFDQGWAIVQASGRSAAALWKCFLIKPDETLVASGCSSVLGAGECSTSVEVPIDGLTLDVQVGGPGFSEGTNCQNAGDGSPSDSQTVSIVPFDSTAVVADGCSFSPTSFSPGDDVDVSSVIQNPNDQPAQVDVEWTIDGQVVHTASGTIDPNSSQTIDDTFTAGSGVPTGENMQTNSRVTAASPA